ncbi:MAG TPA: AAA family ATPase [Desulfomicrobiaceae bacterium]|nr:AAA family ATPase [Desulfomicrobiaceae bacterium]
MEDIIRLSRDLLRVHNRDYLRYFLEKSKFQSRLSIVLGQRGVGKTTAMVQYLLQQGGSNPDDDFILYVQADHILIQDRSLYAIAEEFESHGGRVICFDEIHKFSDWSRELKSIHDTFPGLKVIASGSSAMEIHKGSHDLSRRAVVHTMWGLSFREFLELSLGCDLPAFSLEEILADHVAAARKIVSLLGEARVLAWFGKYLSHGYFPFFFETEDEILFLKVLEQTVHSTVESDLLAVHPRLTGVSARKIIKLLRIIGASVPFVPDLTNLGRLVDVADQRTLKTYLKYLEDGGLLVGLSASGRGLAELEKPGKMFLSSPNMLRAVAAEVNPGTARETFFMSMLRPGHTLRAPARGDFLVDDRYLFEVGGKGKGFGQIKDHPDGYLALDGMEIGFGRKVPLWLFGFLY